MNFTKYLSVESINLYLYAPPVEENGEGQITPRIRKEHKENVVKELAQLLYSSGRIQNANKLSVELINRERKASSAIGEGIAIPHARCMQAKSFTIGFARYEEGVDFDSPDGEPVKLIIPMAAPPYDDKQYLKLYKHLSKAFLETSAKEELLEATHPGEVIRIFNQILR